MALTDVNRLIAELGESRDNKLIGKIVAALVPTIERDAQHSWRLDANVWSGADVDEMAGVAIEAITTFLMNDDVPADDRNLAAFLLEYGRRRATRWGIDHAGVAGLTETTGLRRREVAARRFASQRLSDGWVEGGRVFDQGGAHVTAEALADQYNAAVRATYGSRSRQSGRLIGLAEARDALRAAAEILPRDRRFSSSQSVGEV
jgi:hypothetical protein